MRVSAAHQGSEPVVNQEESNGELPPCVHCQERDNGSLTSPRVVLDLMELSNFPLYTKFYFTENIVQSTSVITPPVKTSRLFS